MRKICTQSWEWFATLYEDQFVNLCQSQFEIEIPRASSDGEDENSEKMIKERVQRARNERAKVKNAHKQFALGAAKGARR